MAKFCTNCGASMDDDRKFCTECGTSVENTPPPQPQPAPPPRQTYQQPQYSAPAYDTAPPPGSPYEPISVLGYIGIMLLMCIPIVGIVLMFLWAFGGCKKINKRNLARASLVVMAVMLIIGFIIGTAVKALWNNFVEEIEAETGINISGEKETGKNDNKNNNKEEEKSGGLLSGLLGIGKTDGTEDGSNSDIEKLDELGNILGGLTGDDELSGVLDDIKDINKDAENKADGWPKSLREYPGGKATSDSAYRTIISDTTADEMMAWIDDLKSDGFEYKDFYDFGMSEDDMLAVNGWWATDGEIYLSLSYSEGKVTIDHTTELPDMSKLFN